MQKDLYVIVGLGLTGLSCARYLASQHIPFAVNDTRDNPPLLAQFRETFPDQSIVLGKLDESLLENASGLIVSPGVSIKNPLIAKQIARGIEVIGDIELFARMKKAPVIAITGTNAKSTVTTLVGEMAIQSGLNTAVGGNLGIPVLDFVLQKKAAELFVLELSSFQLETTYSLAPEVATVLNITPDHMDRYTTLAEYATAKKNVYKNCSVAVCNRDDILTDCGLDFQKQKLHFTLKQPQQNEFGLIQKKRDIYLALEDQLLMPVAELPILGRHYQANALAALAIGHGYGFSLNSMIDALKKFKGLPHRCQLVSILKGVFWYNDSKGTNVGATLAAIEGLGADMQGKMILIAGGVSKNADFSPLIPVVQKYIKVMILMGEAAPLLEDIFGQYVKIYFVKSMAEAVNLAESISKAPDIVLLSPACASLDMFKNFEHRGEVFMQSVSELKN